jgi:hypothetical protein
MDPEFGELSLAIAAEPIDDISIDDAIQQMINGGKQPPTPILERMGAILGIVSSSLHDIWVYLFLNQKQN